MSTLPYFARNLVASKQPPAPPDITFLKTSTPASLLASSSQVHILQQAAAWYAKTERDLLKRAEDAEQMRAGLERVAGVVGALREAGGIIGLEGKVELKKTERHGRGGLRDEDDLMTRDDEEEHEAEGLNFSVEKLSIDEQGVQKDRDRNRNQKGKGAKDRLNAANAEGGGKNKDDDDDDDSADYASLLKQAEAAIGHLKVLRARWNAAGKRPDIAGGIKQSKHIGRGSNGVPLNKVGGH